MEKIFENAQGGFGPSMNDVQDDPYGGILQNEKPRVWFHVNLEDVFWIWIGNR